MKKIIPLLQAAGAFLHKNKVIIIGLLSAVALPVYDLINKGETSVKVLVMAGAVALTSYVARNMRGQWATIASSVGTMLATYLTQSETGQPVTWVQLIGQGILLILGASAPPIKSIGYEQTKVISQAEAAGEKAVPTIAPPPPYNK